LLFGLFLGNFGSQKAQQYAKLAQTPVWDHFQLILGTLRYLCEFCPFLPMFFFYRRIFERVGGYHFFGRKGAPPLISYLRPTMPTMRQKTMVYTTAISCQLLRLISGLALDCMDDDVNTMTFR
jgi:hypothetical protein